MLDAACMILLMLLLLAPSLTAGQYQMHPHSRYKLVHPTNARLGANPAALNQILSVPSLLGEKCRTRPLSTGAACKLNAANPTHMAPT